MDTGNLMSRSSRRDYWQRIYPRYQRARGEEKRRILDEFCANCSYHRKHAIRLLNGPPPPGKPPRRRRRDVTYGWRVISILKAVWEAADYPWSARLKALLPEWMPWILLIPMKAITDSDLIPVTRSDAMPAVFGAKRRWRRYSA